MELVVRLLLVEKYRVVCNVLLAPSMYLGSDEAITAIEVSNYVTLIIYS